MEILTEENLVGAKIAHSLTKGNQASLVRTFLSDPGSESQISRVGGWRRVGQGLDRVGEGLAKGWRRVGEGLAKGLKRFLAPFSFEFLKRPFR